MWQIDVCGMTDIGQKRLRNEDHFLVATMSKTFDVSHSSLDIGAETQMFGNLQGRSLLVADGMGGHPAGDRASTMVVCAFADYVLNMLRWHFRADPGRDADVAADLGDAVLRCQHSIRDEVRNHPANRGMGTTMTLAYVIWPRMFIVHVGDSRRYVLSDRELRQLTRDHTMAQQLVEQAAMTPEQAESSRWQHVLWNSVGGNSDEPQPDIFRVDLEFDDRLLLGTARLTKHVPGTDITHYLQQDRPASEICRQLIDAANAAGGSDNITAIVARFPNPRLVGDELSAVATAQWPVEPIKPEIAPVEALQTVVVA